MADSAGRVSNQLNGGGVPGYARCAIGEARDLLGGNGVLFENHVIRHMGDIEVIHTYKGTDTMQLLIVGRDIAGVGAYV